MGIEDYNKERSELNQELTKLDSFFTEFGELDDKVYSDSVIPKKYKELTGLTISIFSKCEECIIYHLQGCKDAGATKEEIVETIKIAVVGGGSVLYPWVRFMVKQMKELDF